MSAGLFIALLVFGGLFAARLSDSQSVVAGCSWQ
jgi:hypothetical protein